MGDNPSKSNLFKTNTKLHNYSIDDCAKCVKEFSAAKGEYVGTFIEQIRAVQKIFGVDETDLKLLIIKKLSGAAEEWFQSKTSHILMSSTELLEELERVYGNRARLVDLQENFLNRRWCWRENEKFFDYYQEKVKLGSIFNLPEDILVQRIIDGIDNLEWQRQINSFKIEKTSVLLEKMENAIRDYMTDSKIVRCCYCKKDNHPSAKCHFKPDPTKETKPEPCKYCKKLGHAPEKCFFKSTGSPDSKKEHNTEPCKYCKKSGHLSENCYFKNFGLLDSAKPSDKFDAGGSKSSSIRNGTKKKTQSESSVNSVKEMSDHLRVTNLSEEKKVRWRCKSESKQEDDKPKKSKQTNSDKNCKKKDKKDHLLFTYD